MSNIMYRNLFNNDSVIYHGLIILKIGDTIKI